MHRDPHARSGQPLGRHQPGRAAADKVPTDESNLALRAARALADHTGGQEPVHLTIHKEIPVAGGMAGGSADAAAALVACDALWGTDVPKDELEEIALFLCYYAGWPNGTKLGNVVGPHVARARKAARRAARSHRRRSSRSSQARR